jgi:hypothetical protein
MNPNERKLEELMSKMTFDDKPDHRHRDKLEQELLAAFARRQWQQEKQSRQSPWGQAGVWRTIMQNKTRLVAAAAVIAIVGVVSWTMFHKEVVTPMLSAIEVIQKAQAKEKLLFAGDKIVHIMSEITIYRSQYNPKASEMIQKIGDTKMTVEELNKTNKELISSWLINWLPMMSLQPSGEQRLTEIRLAKDANQTYTIYDNSWYEAKTGRFVRTMDINDKVIFANSYDGQFVNITETAADGKVQLKSEAVSANFKAPENPAGFLGMTAGVQQCMTDKCFMQPVQDITKDTLADGTPVHVYKVGFPNPWGDLNTYYLFKIRQADEIIAEIEYVFNNQPQMIIRRVVSEQVDKPDYSWNLAELSSKELAGETPSPVTVASDVAIDNVSVRHMVDKADFETYIFATDPNWTKGRWIVDVMDPMNPPARMFIAIYPPKDNDTRMVMLIQSQTHNKYMSAMFKQAESQGAKFDWKIYANGCKVYRNTGSEPFWTELCFKNANVEPAKDRCGYIVQSPAGTFPLIAVNGPVTEEELTGLINSLIPAKDYQVK